MFSCKEKPIAKGQYLEVISKYFKNLTNKEIIVIGYHQSGNYSSNPDYNHTKRSISKPYRYIKDPTIVEIFTITANDSLKKAKHLHSCYYKVEIPINSSSEIIMINSQIFR